MSAQPRKRRCDSAPQLWLAKACRCVLSGCIAARYSGGSQAGDAPELLPIWDREPLHTVLSSTAQPSIITLPLSV